MSRFEFARRVPGHSATQILWFDFCRFLSGAPLQVLYGMCEVGASRIPRSGPVIFASNHQTLFDPIINGFVASDRQFSAIAREGLFRFPPFGWLITSFGAISIRQDAGDAAAMKAALAELAAGRCVLIYPEGSRSPDGTLQEFKRGVALLLRRANATLVPMGLDGACDIWPPSIRLPRLSGRIAIKVGEPIATSELVREGADQALERLRREIERLRLEARADLRRHSRGRWPKPGPADHAYWERPAPLEPEARATNEPSTAPTPSIAPLSSLTPQ